MGYTLLDRMPDIVNMNPCLWGPCLAGKKSQQANKICRISADSNGLGWLIRKRVKKKSERMFLNF